VLARSSQTSSWTRLVQAVQLADAIWRDESTPNPLRTANPRTREPRAPAHAFLLTADIDTA
jgi:hypothetical protein